jgi:hypothetical protein
MSDHMQNNATDDDMNQKDDDEEDVEEKGVEDENAETSAADQKDDEEDVEENGVEDQFQDATREGEPSVIVKMLKLAENVHETGHIQVWHLINPQQPTVVLKLYATPAQVDEIRSSNLVPSTMVLPLLAVLPSNKVVATGDVSKVMTCTLVDVILCIIIRYSNSG